MREQFQRSFYSVFPEAMLREARGSYFSPPRRCCHLAARETKSVISSTPLLHAHSIFARTSVLNFWGRSACTENRIVAVFPPALTSPSLTTRPTHSHRHSTCDREPFKPRQDNARKHAGCIRSASSRTMGVWVTPKGSPAGTPTCAAANGDQR